MSEHKRKYPQLFNGVPIVMEMGIIAVRSLSENLISSRPQPGRSMKVLFISFVFAAAYASSALAHGGGLDANRCHTDHKTGTYHCH